MYSRRSYSIEEWRIPLAEEPMGLDVLLAVAGDVAEWCDAHSVSTDDMDTARWQIVGWPNERDPEHLVIKVKTEPGSCEVTRRS